MRIDSNTLLVFLLSIFLVLTITSAGMSLNDEWMTAAQLNQLYQGHQIVYNEGKYGYYANGTPSAYMAYRNNILMYPIALPIAALPAMFFLSAVDAPRALVFGTWGLIGLLVTTILIKKRPKYEIHIASLFIAAFFVNTILYFILGDFPYSGPFIPTEVLALVLTNVMLFGALAAIVFVTSKELFGYNLKAWFATAATMICSSAIFWAGTAKDHILTMLLVAIIALALLKFAKQRRMKFLLISAVISGLLTWVRPEIGIGVLFAIPLCAILFTHHFGRKQVIKHIAVVILVLAISLIPFFVNNIVATGDAFKTPFQASNKGYDNVLDFSYYSPPQELYAKENRTQEMEVHKAGPFTYQNILPMLVAPASGAVSLLAIIPLAAIALFSIPEMLRRKFIAKEKFWLITYPERVLLVLALSTMAFHIYKGTIFLQQQDTGIFPDLRYFTPMYGVIILLSLSIIMRTFDVNIKKALKNAMLCCLAMTILFLGLIAVAPSYLALQSHFNFLVSIITLVLLGLSAIFMISDIRNKTKNLQTIILPLLIAIPFSWNLLTTFIYMGTKMAGYPMLLPMSQIIYNTIFGLL